MRRRDFLKALASGAAATFATYDIPDDCRCWHSDDEGRPMVCPACEVE